MADLDFNYEQAKACAQDRDYWRRLCETIWLDVMLENQPGQVEKSDLKIPRSNSFENINLKIVLYQHAPTVTNHFIELCGGS